MTPLIKRPKNREGISQKRREDFSLFSGEPVQREEFLGQVDDERLMLNRRGGTASAFAAFSFVVFMGEQIAEREKLIRGFIDNIEKGRPLFC